MAGKIKELIDKIITMRAKGSEMIAKTTATKMILKGINPANYNSSSPDDPVVIDKLRKLAAEMNIRI
jgi:hypothetical protein